MRAITILQRCRDAEQDLRRIRQRIERRREAAESVTPRINAGGGRSTAEPDKIAAFVAAITELEADLRGREQARRVEVAAACVLLVWHLALSMVVTANLSTSNWITMPFSTH